MRMDIDCALAPAEQVSRIFKSIVAPRPIGWISTLSEDGLPNLAPYSFYNAVEAEPPIVMFSSSGWKDSVRNVAATGEFVANLVTEPLMGAMNMTSSRMPHGENEFDLACLESAPSLLVRPLRVARAAAALECKLIKIEQLHDLTGRSLDTHIVFGQVVLMHVEDRLFAGDRVSVAAEPFAARLGGSDYAVIRDAIRIQRPV
jgi:flavin reductase (DIM6/NTAB) family NADH-FMN oxidoreductase RutF